MSENWAGIARTLIVALIGAGGATLIWTLVRAYLAIRDSAEGREDKAIERLERFERDCRSQLRWERAMGQYWCKRSGTLEHALRVNGIAVPPEEEPQPLRYDVDEDMD